MFVFFKKSWKFTDIRKTLWSSIIAYDMKKSIYEYTFYIVDSMSVSFQPYNILEPLDNKIKKTRYYGQSLQPANSRYPKQSSTCSRYWLANCNYDWRFYGGELTDIF